VHMNGRVYDPAIGRFLSADPFIDCVQSTQGWNRYSYVKNNPLAFTDPSGFSAEPPSAPIRPIDPMKVLEEVIVMASRLVDEAWANHRVGVAMSYVTTTSRPTGATGGGGRSGGDAVKQRDKEHKKCIDKCRTAAEPLVQMTAGATGGALGGLIAGAPVPGLGSGSAALVGGFAGAVTGLVTGALAISTVSGPTSFGIGSATGLAAGGNAALLQGGVNVVRSVATGGIAGSVATVFPASASGVAGAAATSAALAAGAVKLVAAVGLGTAIGYLAADKVAMAACSEMCAD